MSKNKILSLILLRNDLSVGCKAFNILKFCAVFVVFSNSTIIEEKSIYGTGWSVDDLQENTKQYSMLNSCLYGNWLNHFASLRYEFQKHTAAA